MNLNREISLRLRPGSWTIGIALVLATFSQADERAAIRAFERAKRTSPELFLFLKEMPKGGDLHVHLSGAVYSDYLLDAAIAKGLYYDPETSSFGTDATKVPAHALLKDNTLLYQYMNAASMRGWQGGGQSGHDHFFSTFGLISAPLGARNSNDVLAEVVGRAKAQHEQYMELMTSVTPAAATTEYLQDPPSARDYMLALAALRPRLLKLAATVKPYLDAREGAAKALHQGSLTGVDQPITVRYLWSCNRLDSNDKFFAEAAAGIYLAAHEPRVVGMNIVAPEDHPLARTNFLTQMKMIDFLWRALGKPHLSLHGGELTPSISPVETMRDRIRKTIELGHAQRIGHGVSIAWEDNAAGLMAKMKREGIAVEICLTSNASILGVKGEDHPLRLYRAHGVPVFLNTDDEGVSRTTLSLEWVKAVREQKMGYLDLKEMARNSLEFSFLPGRSLFSKHRFSNCVPELKGCQDLNWKPSSRAKKLLAASEKMRVQLRLERELVRFESRFR